MSFDMNLHLIKTHKLRDFHVDFYSYIVLDIHIYIRISFSIYRLKCLLNFFLFLIHLFMITTKIHAHLA